MTVSTPDIRSQFGGTFSMPSSHSLDAIAVTFDDDRLAGELLPRAWSAGAGAGDVAVIIDVDSSICETCELAKQGGSRFTYNHVRGYHPLFAVMAGTGDVVHARLRGGNAHTGRGAA